MVKDIRIHTPFLKGFLKTFFPKNVIGHCTKVELFLTSLVADSFLLAWYLTAPYSLLLLFWNFLSAF